MNFSSLSSCRYRTGRKHRFVELLCQIWTSRATLTTIPIGAKLRASRCGLKVTVENREGFSISELRRKGIDSTLLHLFSGCSSFRSALKEAGRVSDCRNDLALCRVVPDEYSYGGKGFRKPQNLIIYFPSEAERRIFFVTLIRGR